MSREAYLDRRKRQVRAVHPDERPMAALARQAISVDRDHPDEKLQKLIKVYSPESLRELTPAEIQMFTDAQCFVDAHIKKIDGRAKPIPYPLSRVNIIKEGSLDLAGLEHDGAVSINDQMFLQPLGEQASPLRFLHRSVHELLHAKSYFQHNWGKQTSNRRSGTEVVVETQSLGSQAGKLFQAANEALTQSQTLQVLDDVYEDGRMPYGHLRRQWQAEYQQELDFLQLTEGISPNEVQYIDHAPPDTTPHYSAPYHFETDRMTSIMGQIADVEHLDVQAVAQLFKRWHLFGQYQPVGKCLNNCFGPYGAKVLSRWTTTDKASPERKAMLDAFLLTNYDQYSDIRDSIAREFIATSEYNRVLSQARTSGSE